MQRNEPSLNLRAAFVWIAIALCATSAWAATHQILTPSTPAAETELSPLPDLFPDAAGNLYGTADFGGAFNAGTVCELSPNGSGGWFPNHSLQLQLQR